MQLIIIETVSQQYGVDVESDEAGLKAVESGSASVIPGTRTVNRRVIVRPETQQNVGQMRPGIPI